MRIVAAVHDPPVWTLPTSEVQRIASALPEDEVVEARTAEERAREIPQAEVLLATRISSAEAAGAQRLRWIHSTAVGVAGLLVPEMVAGSVVITNVRGAHSRQIAEHAIALVLALRRRLHTAVARQAVRTWAQSELQSARTPTLDQSRLVVVGLGAIGSQVAALGAGLGMRVTGVRRRPSEPAPPGVQSVVGPDRLREALADADAVVLAAPRTADTRAMIGAGELAAMRPSAVLVNVARGRLIDEPALVAALEQGRIAGAGLDAFVREPLPDDHPLWRLPNVLVTPHTAAFGGDYWAPAIDLFLENMARFTRGDPLVNLVDKTRGYLVGLSEPDGIATLPRTIALLPFFAGGRFPKPDLLGRCEGDSVVAISGLNLVARVREIGLGLQALGLTPGDRVLLLAESRPEWLLVDFAILASGGVTVPVYPTLAAEQVGYIVKDAAAALAIVSTATQLEKVLAVAPALPNLRAIVVSDDDHASAAGAARGPVPVETLQDVARRGSEAIRAGWGVAREFHERAKQVRPEDLATIIYTSGTTGEPKGVMLTHANLVANLAGVSQVFEVTEEDTALSFLPLCHGFERMVAYVYLSNGVSMIFAESLETVVRDLRAVRPTVMSGVPRIYEKLYARIESAGLSGGALSRAIFRWASRVAVARGNTQASGRSPSPWLTLESRLADRLVFRTIRASVGGRIRFAVSGSAPLGASLGRFFFGVGMPLIEGYGLTETSPVLTVMPLHGIRFGTVGPALPNVELKIAADGEILARGPNVMGGYYHRPEETAAALQDGWFHTGDIGELDERGYLRITDRKKDLIVTSGGKKIAPAPIEAALRAQGLIAEAVLVGDRRHFPSALIIPEFGALAARVGVPRPADAAGGAALVARPEVRALYAGAVDAVNARLAHFEQIKKFHILPRELTMAAGELTPTLKVRRRVIDQKYKAEIDAMYA